MRREAGPIRATLVAPFALFVLLAPAFAGCLAGDPLEAASAAPLPFPVTLGVPATRSDSALEWAGASLTAPPREGACVPFVCLDPAHPTCAVGLDCPVPECSPEGCERVPFELAFPDGWWDARDGDVVVMVEAPNDWTLGVRVDVYDAAGARVAAGETGWFASVAPLGKPASGKYEAVVTALWGEGAYRGAVVVTSKPKETGDPREMLPNLVTRTPHDLRVETPGSLVGFGLVPSPEVALMRAAGSRGCGFDEFVEQGARRCLRFSNEVGNIGEGPLEVGIAVKDAATTVATGAEAWVQRVYATDGSWREAVVGPAVFHPTHGHYHYKGLAHSTVYAFDLATGTRGDAVDAGKKSGFCFLDSGIVEFARPGTTPPRFDGEGCLVPSGGRAIHMGLSPGWFDLYEWTLPEQYVDITGLEDGVYELESVANGDRTLLESDLDDNAASVVFRLTGDEIEVLDVSWR